MLLRVVMDAALYSVSVWHCESVLILLSSFNSSDALCKDGHVQYTLKASDVFQNGLVSKY